MSEYSNRLPNEGGFGLIFDRSVKASMEDTTKSCMATNAFAFTANKNVFTEERIALHDQPLSVIAFTAGSKPTAGSHCKEAQRSRRKCLLRSPINS